MPDPETGLLPSKMVFGRRICDFLPCNLLTLHLQQGWRNEAALREQQASHRVLDRGAVLDEHARTLSPLQAGDAVAVQDLDGNSPRRWTKTGIVVESHPSDSYSVKLDGSRHVTRRNWQFLCPIHQDFYYVIAEHFLNRVFCFPEDIEFSRHVL